MADSAFFDTSAGEAYLGRAIGPYASVYVAVQIYMTSAAKAILDANTTFSGDFFDLTDDSIPTNSWEGPNYYYLAPNWITFGTFSPPLPTSFTADAWHLFEIMYDDSALAQLAALDGVIYTDTLFGPLASAGWLDIGQRFAGALASTGAYIGQVWLGSTAGTHDILREDWSSGTSHWTTSVGSVTVGNAPTPTPFLVPALTSAPASASEGIRIAFASNTYDTTPVWVRIDDPNFPAVAQNSKSVTHWETHRGRQYELDKTQAGTAAVTLVDTEGRFDPTNPAGPYFGNLGPLRQFKINVQDPVTLAYHDIFTGFVESWDYSFADQSERTMNITVNATDGFELLTRAELVPGSTGTTILTGAKIDAFLNAVLDDVGWPTLWRNIFSGNVDVQTAIYNPQTTALSVLQDGADAEFPNVANVFMDKFGDVAFRGRWSRLNPSNYEQDPPTASHPLRVWHVGDREAAETFGYALISDIQWTLDLKNVINDCLCYPYGIAQNAIAGQNKLNAASIAKYGTRVLTIPDLIVQSSVTGPPIYDPPGGDGSGKPQSDPSGGGTNECQIIGQYYVDNYGEPVEMVNSITFRSVAKSDSLAAPQWKFLTGVEIGDLVVITQKNPGGGGFNAKQFFVEGIHNVIAGQLDDHVVDWTMNLDLSPRAWYSIFDGVTYFSG